MLTVRSHVSHALSNEDSGWDVRSSESSPQVKNSERTGGAKLLRMAGRVLAGPCVQHWLDSAKE